MGIPYSMVAQVWTLPLSSVGFARATRRRSTMRERLTPLDEIVSLWTHRRVLGLLALHDLRRAYAGTAAGVLWTFVTPIIPMVIFSTIFAFGLRLPLGGAPYIFGFAAAYVPWVLLSA